MTITLSPDQLAWIEARVAAGEFPDVDVAVHRLLANAITERDEIEDDMAWAKPLVDEAEAAIVQGDVLSVEELEAQLDAKFGAVAD